MSNSGRAEIAVKAAKGIVHHNISPDSSLDNDNKNGLWDTPVSERTTALHQLEFLSGITSSAT